MNSPTKFKEETYGKAKTLKVLCYFSFYYIHLILLTGDKNN